MTRQILTLSFLLFSLLTLTAQDLQRLQFDVSEDDQSLRYPFTGGFKAPQFSQADLNNDGTPDLYVFDRAGDVQMAFISRGTSNTVDFDFQPFFVSGFPELNDWVLLRDYDGDGIVDIFAQSDNSMASGVLVYKGRYQGNRLVFDRLEFNQISIDIIPVSTGGGNFTQLFVDRADIPAIDDLDGDGDLDVLTFTVAGGSIFYYENQSVEMGYGRDSLIFRRIDDCWGRFFETGITNCLNLSSDPDLCAEGFQSSGVHPGSTILTFDEDNDGDKEILLGDISFNSLVFGINEGDRNVAWMTDQDCNFPSYDRSLDITTFPSSFLADLDNDGLLDLVSASNSDNIGVSFESIWWYKNTDSNETPRFSWRANDFLISETIQVGLGSNPVFVDYNADGLLDILVGNARINMDDESTLLLYENTGTENQPAFRLVDDDYLGFRDLFRTTSELFNFTPAFGDLDGDGDADLVCGSENGTLLYAENTAGPNQPFQFGPLSGNYMGIDIGGKSVPQIIDLDRDGLLDLIVGQRTINQDPVNLALAGNIIFYRNRGTVTNPIFASDPELDGGTPYLGLVNTIELGPNSSNAGSSAPFFYDVGDDFLLFSGSSSGNLFVYDQIEGNLTGRFNQISSNYGNLNVGIETRISVADLNNDGFLDVIVGNKRGGLDLFATNYKVDGTVNTKDVLAAPDLRLVPNPATDWIQLEWEGLAQYSRADLVVYDARGQRLTQRRVEDTVERIDVANWPSGLYVAELRVDGQRVIRKFVVQ